MTAAAQDALIERAGVRALLWAIGQYPVHQAIDLLVDCGLGAALGQDCIGQIFSDAFAPYELAPPLRIVSMTTDEPRLNGQRRPPTPQTTIEAIIWCVRTRGLAALQEPANIERLFQCDADARAQINKRIESLLKKETQS
jgi:hypothetical protein